MGMGLLGRTNPNQHCEISVWNKIQKITWQNQHFVPEHKLWWQHFGLMIPKNDRLLRWLVFYSEKQKSALRYDGAL